MIVWYHDGTINGPVEVNLLQRAIASRSGEMNPITVILAILVIVVFVSAAYGIFENVGSYLPPWVLALVIAVLGIGLVLFFRSKSD